jgi:hypothetical protein
MATAVEDRVSERHTPTVLIETGQGNFCVVHFTNRVAGNEGCGMTVWP